MPTDLFRRLRLSLAETLPFMLQGPQVSAEALHIDPGVPSFDAQEARQEARILAEPGVMMPELGRGLLHAEGVDLLRGWIAPMNPTDYR